MSYLSYFAVLVAVLLVCYFLFSSLFAKILKKSTEWIFREAIVFNCVWEDPHIDKVALELEEDESVVLTITSGGCNVLSLVLDKPKHIYSVDKNPCQNALLELKIAAIKELDYEIFWEMFGEGRIKDFTKIWYPRLRQHLSAQARKFWDKNSSYFDGKSWIGRNSFYYYGSSGVLAWIMSKIYFKLVPGLEKAIHDIIHAKDVEEQKKFTKKDWKKNYLIL